MQVTGGVGPPLTYPVEIGSGYEDVGSFLHSGCSGGAVIWVRDLGGEPPHGADPGGFHHRVASTIIGKLPNRQLDGVWDKPPIAEGLWDTGIEEI